MPAPTPISLPDGTVIPVLHEDRSVLAIDKPAGWILGPESWDRTGLNLLLALTSSIRGRDFWARSRNLKFLRYVHRLDAGTTGVLLFAKSPGAVRTYSELFAQRRVVKVYLAVVSGRPKQPEWISTTSLAPDPKRADRMISGGREGQPAETRFRLVQSGSDCSLVEVMPITGRTHQIRVHLAQAGFPVLGDALYAPDGSRPLRPPSPLALRSVVLAYRDPFQGRPVRIQAPADEFLRTFGFASDAWIPRPLAV